MERSLLLLMILSLFLGAGCWLFFLWGVKRGEFDDIERSKYRMLDDDLPLEGGRKETADADDGKETGE